MFADNKNIDNFLLNETVSPFIIIDRDGNVVSSSDEIKKDFVGVKNIFDIINEKSRKRLSDPIISGNVHNTEITLKRIDSGANIQAELDEINFDGKNLFKISMKNVELPENKNTLKIDLYSGSIENYLPRNSAKIVDVIKSNYPFTIIGKSKTQRLLDDFSGFFWVKTIGGRFELVNKNFAEFLGMPPRNIEGRTEKEVLPKYLSKLFIDANNYIARSGNNLLLEDRLGSMFLGRKKFTKIVQIPLIDIDNKVVAIVSFTVDSLDDSKLTKSGELTTYLDVSDWLVPVILIDNRGDILSFSGAANEILIKGRHSEFLNISDFVDKKNVDILTDFFLNEDETKSEFNFEHKSKKIKVHMQKLRVAGESALALLYLNVLSKEELNSSETMYETILQNFPSPALIYNIDNLKFLDVNNSALKLYGYTREEFLTLDLTDLYAPEDIQSLIESPTGKKSDANVPMRQKCKDGSFIIVEIGKIEIEYKGVGAHFSTIKDVSEKIELEKKLQLYKSAFENSDDPIVITDLHGFVKFINDSFTDYFGYTKAEIEQNPISTIFSDKFRSVLNTNLFQSEYHEEKKIDAEVKTNENAVLNVNIIGTPIFGFNEQVERFSLIFKVENDGTVLQKSQGELQQKGIDSTFLSNLFHELLTPLNVIIGFVQELTESIGKPTEEQREAIQIIAENQKVLLQTMDIAVEYSHLEQDYIDLTVTDVAFVELLNNLEESTKKTAESNEVKLNYGKISSSLHFETDQHKFLTFLIQMIHFSLIMTHESNIFISGNYFEKDKFVIGIKDRKSGISEEMIGNLKDIFNDDEMNIRKNYGLSRFTVRLVRKLLEILKGEIRSIPSAAHPTDFGIIFPLKLEVAEPSIEREMLETVITQDIPQAAPAPAPVQQQTERLKEVNLSNLSCLYVEDQVDSQLLFKVQMKGLKSIEFANSFEKALPLLKSKKFDFIVMDINLQGEYNGLDALKIIKKMPGYEDIPILAVTAYVVPGAAEKFRQAGFNEFVNKPLLREKVVEALRKVL